MAYEDEPIRETGIIHCCMCTPDVQILHHKTFESTFGETVTKVTKYWCKNCGRMLSNKDLDEYAANQIE